MDSWRVGSARTTNMIKEFPDSAVNYRQQKGVGGDPGMSPARQGCQSREGVGDPGMSPSRPGCQSGEK